MDMSATAGLHFSSFSLVLEQLPCQSEILSLAEGKKGRRKGMREGWEGREGREGRREEGGREGGGRGKREGRREE